MEEYDESEFEEGEGLKPVEIAEQDVIYFGTKLTIRPEMMGSFVPALGLTVNDEGKLEDYETGEIIVSPDGEELTVEEIGYLGYDEENGQVEPVRNEKSAIVAYLNDLGFFWD